jgi:hypothetical protein
LLSIFISPSAALKLSASMMMVDGGTSFFSVISETPFSGWLQPEKAIPKRKNDKKKNFIIIRAIFN